MSIYPLKTFGPGESFLVPADDATWFRANCYQYARQWGIKIATRLLPDGTRQVWRVDDGRLRAEMEAAASEVAGREWLPEMDEIQIERRQAGLSALSYDALLAEGRQRARGGA